MQYLIKFNFYKVLFSPTSSDVVASLRSQLHFPQNLTYVLDQQVGLLHALAEVHSINNQMLLASSNNLSLKMKYCKYIISSLQKLL